MTEIACVASTTESGARIATVTVDNRARLNVLGRAAMDDLAAAFAEAGGEAGVRAIVLRGAGEKAWIGGADIGEMAALGQADAAPFISALHGVCAAIRSAPVPVIAAIRGYCLGAGLEVAAACDMRIGRRRRCLRNARGACRYPVGDRGGAAAAAHRLGPHGVPSLQPGT